MKTVSSMAVEKKCKLRKTVDNSAFLQANGFARYANVRLLRKEGRCGLQKLVGLSCGSTESQCYWNMTAQYLLTVITRIAHSRYDPSMYHERSAVEVQLLVGQVEDFSYVGIPPFSKKLKPSL